MDDKYIFNLPYWKNMLLLHNLEVTHVCDSADGTLVDLDGKAQVNLNACSNLEKMHITNAFHPITRDDENIILPVACHTKSLVSRKFT